MAVIAPAQVMIGRQDGTNYRVTWTPVTEADSCGPVSFPDFNDVSIQVFGTFGSCSVALHGSLDGGTTFAALRSPSENAIAITSAALRAVLESAEQVKPVVTGGTSQSITIVMKFHQTQNLRV